MPSLPFSCPAPKSTSRQRARHLFKQNLNGTAGRRGCLWKICFVRWTDAVSNRQVDQRQTRSHARLAATGVLLRRLQDSPRSRKPRAPTSSNSTARHQVRVKPSRESLKTPRVLFRVEVKGRGYVDASGDVWFVEKLRLLQIMDAVMDGSQPFLLPSSSPLKDRLSGTLDVRR